MSLTKERANTSSLHFPRTSNASPIIPKPAQENNSKKQEQAPAEAEAQAEEPRHSPLTTWAYQTENSHLTIHEKLEKDRWECGSGNGNGNGSRKGEARL